MPATDPSWRPIEMFPDQLFHERTWLAGIILTAVGYGVVLTLFGMCFKLLISSIRRHNVKQRMGFIAYITLVFLCGTFYIAAGARMTELSFIDYRNIPDGPAAFETVMYSIPVNVFGNCAFCIAGWLGDGLMVWRCWVIYKNSRFPLWAVMLLPIAIYLASIVLGILWLVQIVAPEASPWATTNSSINYTSPYLWTSFALNVSMTVAIVARLTVFRWRVSHLLGDTYGAHYTSAAAIVIESSFISSAFFLLFLIPFSISHPIQNVFVQLLGEILIISPLLIIYRVASGAAWTNDTSTALYSQSTASKSSRQPERINLKSGLQFTTPPRSRQSHGQYTDTTRAMSSAGGNDTSTGETELRSPVDAKQSLYGDSSSLKGESV